VTFVSYKVSEQVAKQQSMHLTRPNVNRCLIEDVWIICTPFYAVVSKGNHGSSVKEALSDRLPPVRTSCPHNWFDVEQVKVGGPFEKFVDWQ
jgi:hypothetical protein